MNPPSGIHSKGWSREQAIRYMRESSSVSESDVVAEVERYIVIPGQALGYKIGQLTITALRREAERELDEFHSGTALPPSARPPRYATMNAATVNANRLGARESAWMTRRRSRGRRAIASTERVSHSYGRYARATSSS